MQNCKSCIYMYEDDCCENDDSELIPYCILTDIEVDDIDAENKCPYFREVK